MYNWSRAFLPEFTLKLKVKLQINGDSYLSQTAQVDYILRRVKGKALNVIMTQTNKETEILTITTVAKLLTTLKNAFGDSNPIYTA